MTGPFLIRQHLVKLRVVSGRYDTTHDARQRRNLLRERARVLERIEQLTPHHAVIST